VAFPSPTYLAAERPLRKKGVRSDDFSEAANLFSLISIRGEKALAASGTSSSLGFQTIKKEKKSLFSLGVSFPSAPRVEEGVSLDPLFSKYPRGCRVEVVSGYFLDVVFRIGLPSPLCWKPVEDDASGKGRFWVVGTHQKVQSSGRFCISRSRVPFPPPLRQHSPYLFANGNYELTFPLLSRLAMFVVAASAPSRPALCTSCQVHPAYHFQVGESSIFCVRQDSGKLFSRPNLLPLRYAKDSPFPRPKNPFFFNT